MSSRAAVASQLTPAQQTFIKAITDQVSNLLSTQLPGSFQMVSYPPGFNYAIQWNQPPLTNVATLQAFDSLLSVGSNGMLTMGEAFFSTTYLRILAAVAYQYSAADNKVVQDPNLQSQQIAVASTASSSGYTNQFPITGNVTYYTVIKSVLTNFGATGHQTFSSSDIAAAAKALNSAGFASLGAAISNAINQLAPLNAILNAQNQAEQELAAAQANTQNPSATNGALQTGINPTTYWVSWGNGQMGSTGGLPTNNQILGGLQSGSSVSVKITASNFSSTQTHLTIAGSTGFTVDLGFVTIGVSASTSYDMSRYTASGSSLDITTTYPGVSIVEINPTNLSADFSTGWYDQGLLQSIVNGSGNSSISGFKLPAGSQYNVADTFGPGKLFSRFKALVISQNPTIKMEFSAAQASAVTSDFKEGSSVNVKLFGLFTIGSASQTYEVKKVDTTSVAGKIIVTFAPPKITGTVPINQQVCYVLGGVAEYPPNN